MSQNSDHGTRISTSPNSSQIRRRTTRSRRVNMSYGLWEILAGVATASPASNNSIMQPAISWRSWRAREARGSQSAFLECCDAVGYVTVINIHRINLAEAIERGLFLACFIERQSQIVAQCQDGFLLEAGDFQRALIPERGNFRL